jgi:drug/metabolite transporter (DMT)-like permease
MSFYVLAWIASIFYAIESIIGKLTSKYSVKNPWLFNYIWGSFSLFLIIPFAFYYHVSWPRDWMPLLIASVFYGLGGLLYILGLYFFDISVFTPLFNFRSIFTVLFSVLILGEALSLPQYFLIGIIFLAGMFVTMDETLSLRSFFRWPILVILADMVALAFMSIFIKKAMVGNDYWTVTLGLALISQVLLLATVPLFWKDLKFLSLKNYPPIFYMAIFGFVATLAANKAYASNAGITATIIGLPLSMVMAFVFSIFAPQLLEKHIGKVYLIRFIAAAIMVVAAIKLSQ